MRFPDDEAVRRLAQRLAATGGRRLDDATPYVDLRLPDGTRFHAVLAPTARPGTVISLRVPAARVFTLDELVAAGAVTDGGRRAAARDRRAPGRRSWSAAAPASARPPCSPPCSPWSTPSERLVLVEDASELRPDHPHVVGLEARPPNIEGAGEITLRTLVRQALRMRPDRLVVGEVRGAEVVDMLAALNTGHDGGCGTLHANSAADVPARIEALALAAGLPRAAAHSQLAVRPRRRGPPGPGGRRRTPVAQVGVPSRGADGLVSLEVAVSFDAAGRVETGTGRPRAGRRISP